MKPARVLEGRVGALEATFRRPDAADPDDLLAAHTDEELDEMLAILRRAGARPREQVAIDDLRNPLDRERARAILAAVAERVERAR